VTKDRSSFVLLPREASCHGVFDLCIEALSVRERCDIERDTVTKKAEYAAGGVPEYYILHPAPEHQAFFTRTVAGVYVPLVPEDGVIRSLVLPGLQFRLADLATQPAPKTMHRDPVYADFLLPGWEEAERQVATEREARRLAEKRAVAEAQLPRSRRSVPWPKRGAPMPRRRPGRRPSGHWPSCGRNWRRGDRTDPPSPDCRGYRIHPDGDCPIIDSALNNFVFFLPFVVQLSNSRSTTGRQPRFEVSRLSLRGRPGGLADRWRGSQRGGE
jgi:hypothetical protein